MNREGSVSYLFKTFRLDVDERRLLDNGQPIALTPKAFDVLVYLVEHDGHLVEKEDIMHAVWTDSFVEEANVAKIIHTLRKVLGDNQNGNKFIETVATKGYRFVADVTATVATPNRLDEDDSIFGRDDRRKDLRTGGAPETERATDPSLSPRRGGSRSLVIFAAITFVVLLGASVWINRWWSNSRSDSVKLKAVTTSGNISFPAISPDGRLFAFVKTEAGKPSLWIRQIALRSSEIRLTEPKTDEIFIGVSFTPDGSKVYFLLKPRNNSVKQLYSVPIFGGETPSAILADVDSRPAFAPDGKRFAFMRKNVKDGITALLVADQDGSNLRELTTRKAPMDFLLKPLTWSPDGQTIVCFSTGKTSITDRYLVQIDANNGEQKYISEQTWVWVDTVVWAKNNELIFSASDAKQPLGLQLWSVPSSPGMPSRRLTNDLHDYTDLSIAADTDEISAVQAQWDSYVWLEDLKSPGVSRRVSSNKADGSQGIAWKPDGELIYSSIINGRNSLQRLTMSDFSSAPITADDKYVFRNPIVTPDGRHIVFTSNQEEPEGLWRMDLDGRNPRRIVSIGSDLASSSADGQTIFFSSVQDGHAALWKVSIDGGEAQRLSEKISLRPIVSPDGKLIACYFRADAKAPWQIAIMPINEDRILQIFELPKSVSLSSQFAWAGDSSAMILIDSRDSVNNLWRYPLDGQTPTQLTKLTDDSYNRIVNFAFSPNGEQIALTRGRRTSDVVMIESPTQ